MLTQQHLPPPVTSTVKLSLFMHMHSSPVSLAARLPGCCANCSRYINNSWTFFWTDLINNNLVVPQLGIFQLQKIKTSSSYLKKKGYLLKRYQGLIDSTGGWGQA